MTFQTAMNFFKSPGIPGDLAFMGPDPRVQTRIINSSGTPNVFGYVYTESADGDTVTSNTVTVGGTGLFAGVLVQPKAAHTFGTVAGGGLAPTLTLPDKASGEMLSLGSYFAVLPTGWKVGDVVSYTAATGAIADTFAAQAIFTAAQATTVLTVSAITSGNIGIGTVVRSATGARIGEVIALGTGTGGTGTYTLDTSATVASSAMNGNSAASAAGTKLVPNTKVDYYPAASGTIGVVTLTN